MRVLQITRFHHDGSVGGIERYLRDLASGLESRGHASPVLWLCSEGAGEPEPERTGVFTLSVASSPLAEPAPDLHARVDAILARQPVEALHFHSFGVAEAEIARAARRRGLPLAFTFHHPGVTCRRDTLLRWGKTPCDGGVRPVRCSACLLQARAGVPPGLGYPASALSLLGSRWLGARESRGIGFAAATKRLRDDLAWFLDACDRVFHSSERAAALLVRNGARPESLSRCAHGAPSGFALPPDAEAVVAAARPSDGTFTVGFVGRMSPVKGVHLLLDGFLRTPHPNARLRIVGWRSNERAGRYARELARKAADDSRVVFRPGLPLDRAREAYRGLDALAIPSVWLETGPLVLLEALALGIPVLASTNVADDDLVRRHGRLVAPNDPETWQRTLGSVFEEHAAGGARLGQDTLRPALLRSMDDVAVETIQSYESMTGRLGA